jgi:hypothetical protein
MERTASGRGGRASLWALMVVVVMASGCVHRSSHGGFEPLMDNTAVVDAGAFQTEGSMHVAHGEAARGGVAVRRGLGRDAELILEVGECAATECGEVALGGRWAVSGGSGFLPALRIGGALGGARASTAWLGECVAGWDAGGGWGVESVAVLERRAGRTGGALGLELSRVLGEQADVYAGGSVDDLGDRGIGLGFVARPVPGLELDLGVWRGLGGAADRGLSLTVARHWRGRP